MAEIPEDLRDAVDWAKQEAGRLEDRSKDEYARRSETASAVAFLERHAGPASAFTAAAKDELQHLANYSFQGVAQALRQWVASVESGMIDALPYEARSRIDAADDLIEQALFLLDEKSVHVAAPIVLVGAALEMFLRAQIAKHGLAITGKPSISTYADTLKKAGHLTRQDAKDITSWAGLRNDAAHGDFDDLSGERAKLMIEGVNVFIRQKLGSGT